MQRLLYTILVICTLSGCSVVGGDPSCDEHAEGLSCHSAKEVLLMTNYSSDLENLTPEEKAALQMRALGYVKQTKKSTSFTDFFAREDHGHDETKESGRGATRIKKSDNDKDITAIDTALSVDTFKQLEMLKQAEMLKDEQSIMRTDSKVLRLKFATWEDDDGRLHDPGKIYVEIESRKWVLGKERRVEMPVITPLQIRKTSLEEIKKRNGG